MIDLAGQRFGRLTVIGIHSRQNGVMWLCACDCGKETIGRSGHLRAGSKISCGCAVVDAAIANVPKAIAANTTHGRSHTRLDRCLKNMRRRCYDPKNNRYAQYGGRGIKVCDEWLADPSAFFHWADTHGYADHLTIDRINNDGPYSPENCRWATFKEQMNNQSKSVFLEWAGRRQTVAQWAEELGVKYRALQHRVDRGWSIERIFVQPFRKSPTQCS